MGDTKISYDEQFGIGTFKREICSELGEPFWLELTDGLVLPDMETEAGCKCCNMHTFICRLEAMADEKTVRKILYRVRHGIHPSQSAWAREEFLEIGDLDMFLQKHLETETERFIELNRELESRVVRSVLNKDLTCEYEITIPEDIMTQYIAPRGMENVIDTRKNE